MRSTQSACNIYPNKNLNVWWKMRDNKIFISWIKLVKCRLVFPWLKYHLNVAKIRKNFHLINHSVIKSKIYKSRFIKDILSFEWKIFKPFYMIQTVWGLTFVWPHANLRSFIPMNSNESFQKKCHSIKRHLS